MHTPKKGIFKGLRYIAQIFGNKPCPSMLIITIFNKLLKICPFADNSEKKSKSEFKIGLPTDVKHVAHIGWDGPSVHTPSWVIPFFFLTLNIFPR